MKSQMLSAQCDISSCSQDVHVASLPPAARKRQVQNLTHQNLTLLSCTTGDHGHYNGWVIGFDAVTLDRVATWIGEMPTFNTTINSTAGVSGSALWCAVQGSGAARRHRSGAL
jgi:hypothetical protein